MKPYHGERDNDVRYDMHGYSSLSFDCGAIVLGSENKSYGAENEIFSSDSSRANTLQNEHC